MDIVVPVTSLAASILIYHDGYSCPRQQMHILRVGRKKET